MWRRIILSKTFTGRKADRVSRYIRDTEGMTCARLVEKAVTEYLDRVQAIQAPPDHPEAGNIMQQTKPRGPRK